MSFIKKVDKSTYTKPDSYRGLTMSSYFGKILERILDRRIQDHIGFNGDLDEDQEGFTRGRSTTRYLFRLVANLNEIKRKKMACIILFIDFEKAFDSVHIPTLITKLNKFGVNGKLLKLINNFLINRKVCLKVNNHVGK